MKNGASLAADASTLSDRFSVLAISIVYRGCGIPIAWKIVEGTIPGSWKPHWEELFRHINHTVPSDWFVIVTTDRGLYASVVIPTNQEHWLASFYAD